MRMRGLGATLSAIGTIRGWRNTSEATVRAGASTRGGTDGEMSNVRVSLLERSMVGACLTAHARLSSND
jgi:hypothetical protein